MVNTIKAKQIILTNDDGVDGEIKMKANKI